MTTSAQRIQALESFLYDMDFRTDTKANLSEIVDNLERLGFSKNWYYYAHKEMQDVTKAIYNHLDEIEKDYNNEDLSRRIVRKLFRLTLSRQKKEHLKSPEYKAYQSSQYLCNLSDQIGMAAYSN